MVAAQAPKIPTKQELLALCDCQNCPLNPVRAPVMGYGAQGAQVALIGEAPGKKEAFLGRPFLGPAGELLDGLLNEVGQDRQHVYITNTTLCRPPTSVDGKNTAPPAAAIKACAPRLHAELQACDPKVLMPLGTTAVNAVMGTEAEKITQLVGQTLWSPLYDRPVVPTIHPAAVLHTGGSYVEDILEALRRGFAFAQGTLPFPKRDSPITFHDCRTRLEGLTAIIEMSLSDLLSLDTETEGLRYSEDRLIMLQISNGIRTWVFTDEALNHVDCRGYFRMVLGRDDITWVMHNMKFDLQVLQYNYGVQPTNVHDTMCLAMGLSEQPHRTGLKLLSSQYLSEPYYAGTVDAYKEKGGFGEVPHEQLAEYGARDALNTHRLYPILTELVQKEGTYDLYTNLLRPVARAFTDMEYRGVPIDRAWIEHLRQDWQPQIDAAQLELQTYAEALGYPGRERCKGRGKNKVFWLDPLNPSSYPQLAEIAYDYLHLEKPLDKHGRRTQKRTTDASFRAYHAGQPFVTLIENYRQRKHLMDAYVEGIDKHVWTDTRVHPDFRLWGAVTGRISITKPALQTVPHYRVDPQLAFDVRRIFVPDNSDFVIGEVDYAQLEVHVLHHFSGDDALRSALAEDFHTLMASRLLRKAKKDVLKIERQMSKTLIFGIIYGMGDDALAHKLNVPKAIAARYIAEFWEMYPTARQWQLDLFDEVRETAQLRTPFGRIRRWPLWTPENTAGNLREAGNFPIQSFASDLNLHALTTTNKVLPERNWGYPLFPVHDSQVFMLRKETAMEALRFSCDTMSTCPFPTCATFPVEASLGPNWAETKEVKL